jgi:hypothetical protein
MSKFQIARAQYIKVKRAETRLRFTLMADAAIAENIDKWKMEFELAARDKMPEVLDLQSELRRLTAGEPVA